MKTHSLVPVPLRLQYVAHVAGSESEGFAPGVGVTAFMLLGPLELGASAMAETQILGYSRAQLAVHAGASLRFRYLEVDLAGTFGRAGMAQAGGYWDETPGAEGGTGVVGVRLGFGVPVFRTKSRALQLAVGLTLGFEHDLALSSVVYGQAEGRSDIGEDSISLTRLTHTQRAFVQMGVVMGLN